MYTDEFINKYPVEEATCEESDYHKAFHSIIFPYPEILQKHGCGELISFWTDGTNTYFETSGEKPSNAGVLSFREFLQTWSCMSLLSQTSSAKLKTYQSLTKQSTFSNG